jgi:citrate lyase beta subunit
MAANGFPQVLRLAFGHLDFQTDTSLVCGPVETELVPVRLVLASRRAGCGGKLCIHPAQVAVVNAAFASSRAELDWARRVAAAFAAAACSALMAAWWTHRCRGSRGKRWRRLCAEVVCPNVSRYPLLQNGGVDERDDFLNLLC